MTRISLLPIGICFAFLLLSVPRMLLACSGPNDKCIVEGKFSAKLCTDAGGTPTPDGLCTDSQFCCVMPSNPNANFQAQSVPCPGQIDGKQVQGYCKQTCTAPEVNAGSCGDPVNVTCCAQPAISSAGASRTVSAGSPIQLEDPLKGIGILGVINRLIMTFLGMVGAIALLAFVYAGVKYMTAGGDDSDVKEAKEIMRATSIGLIIILGAYTITTYYFTVLTQDVAPPAAKQAKPAKK